MLSVCLSFCCFCRAPPLLRQSITRTFVVAGSSRRSRQRTRKPRCASRAAVTAPIGPAPHTMARGASCDAPVVALCALARAVRRRAIGMWAVFERFTGIGRAAAAMRRCSESVTDVGVCHEILICLESGLKFVAAICPQSLGLLVSLARPGGAECHHAARGRGVVARENALVARVAVAVRGLGALFEQGARARHAAIGGRAGTAEGRCSQCERLRARACIMMWARQRVLCRHARARALARKRASASARAHLVSSLPVRRNIPSS